MTKIKLTHFGEEIVTEMLRELASAKKLDQVRCALGKTSFKNDIDNIIGAEEVNFFAEEATLKMEFNNHSYKCDPYQKIDMLCTSNTISERSIACEIKLGETFDSSAKFKKQFLEDKKLINKQNKNPNLLKGSMISFLERKFFEAIRIEDGQVKLYAEVNKKTTLVGEKWWLVIRKSIFKRWGSSYPILNARILIFEDLVKLYENIAGIPFDSMVAKLIGGDFKNTWKIK